MRYINVETTEGIKRECVYNVDELPLYDIMMSSPVYKRRQIYYIEIPAAFDIETTNMYELSEDGQVNSDAFRPYAFMYHWQFCIGRFVCFGRTWDEFKHLLRRLEAAMNLSANNRLVVYVHNLNFEFTFMKYFITIIDSFFKEEDKPLKFCTDGGIEFRDSYALSNMNLLKFCENSGAVHVKLSGDDYDYNKLRTPETPLTEYEEGYCYNDVRGLCECIARRYADDHVTKIPLTSTGYVRRICRANMRANPANMKMFRESRLDAELYTMFKEAFRGGDVHGNAAYADQTLTDVFSFDLSSAYPGTLCRDKYPIGKFRHIAARRFKYNRSAEHCYIMRLRVDKPRYIGKCGNPYISVSKIIAMHPNKEESVYIADNGRLRYYDGIIELTVLDIDYDIIRKEYEGRFWISDVYMAKADYLPKEFTDTVKDFFAKKTQLKGIEEKYYEYCRSKEYLNALYGMCATKIDNNDVIYDQKTHSFHTGRLNEETGEYESVPLQEKLDRYYKNRNNFLPYQWGAYCTAYVRRQLREALETGCGKYTVYNDTDSCKGINYNKCKEYFDTAIEAGKQIAQARGMTAKDAKGNIHYMGVWEFEGIYDEFRHIGSKRYCAVKNGKVATTIAGVNKARAAEYFQRAGIDKFTDGTVIKNSGHLVAYYNDDSPHSITVNGCTFETASNVALVNDTYTLGIERRYRQIIEDLKKDIYILNQV